MDWKWIRNCAVMVVVLMAGVVRAGRVGELDGKWVVASAVSNGNSKLGETWNSVLMVKDRAFEFTHACGSDAVWRGRFSTGVEGDGRAVDLALEGIDLSEIWTGVTYPACRLRGIYGMEGKRLQVCMALGEKLARPTALDGKGRDVLLMTFERAREGYAGVPKEVVVTVKDEAGKAVAGASVFSAMYYIHWDDVATARGWHYSDEQEKTGADGEVRVMREKLHVSSLTASVEEGKRRGVLLLSPALLQGGTATIVVSSTTEVHGKLRSAQLESAGKGIGWTNVMLEKEGERIGSYMSMTGEYSFALPAGDFMLEAYGTDLWHKRVALKVPAGATSLEVPAISLVASQRALLEGREAPELKGILAWRGKPVKFSEMRGKYVLVDFWGYWCGPCVRAMPVLMALDEKYREKGLVVMGVHVDDGVDSVAKLEEKIALLKKEVWKGKDIAFPVAVADGKELKVEGIDQPVCGEAAAEYGVLMYPTTILIDREGKVAGTFDAQDKKGAMAAMEKLLAR